MNILISACLLGVNCTYNGIGKSLDCIDELMEKHTLIPVCPEIFGGLPTPRTPAEILENKIITKTGEDVTKEYETGAEEVVKLAKLYQCRYAILKDRSPSCGKGMIYDGSFSGVLIPGNGVCVSLLEKIGVECIQESKAKEFLSRLG